MTNSKCIKRRGGKWATAFVLAGVFGGCQTPPPPPPVTVEAALPGVNEMVRFADETAKKLAQEIPTIAAIRRLDTKGVLELGSLANETRLPPQDFAMMQSRVEAGILRSDQIQKVLVPIERPAGMAQEWAASQGPAAEDPLQEPAAGGGGPDRYDPASTFVLQGRLFETERGGKATFYFRFTMVNLQSRQKVFDKDYLLTPGD